MDFLLEAAAESFPIVVNNCTRNTPHSIRAPPSVLHDMGGLVRQRRSEVDWRTLRQISKGATDWPQQPAHRPSLGRTVYNGCFDDQSFQRIASTILTVFNDAIIRVAIEHSLPVIDLRSVCATTEDYANSIEPSSVGGEKIARVIVGLVCGAKDGTPATRIVIA